MESMGNRVIVLPRGDGQSSAGGGINPVPSRPAAGRDGTPKSHPQRDGTGRDGTGRDGTGRDGTGRDGTGRDGTGRDGTGRDRSSTGCGTGRDGTGRDGTGRDGTEVARDAGRDGTTSVHVYVPPSKFSLSLRKTDSYASYSSDIYELNANECLVELNRLVLVTVKSVHIHSCTLFI